MIAKKWIVLLVSVVVCHAGYAENSPLLPRPQKVRYGNGSVALRGMRIMFASAPDAEDRFAAEELRSWMRERTGLEIQIGSYGNGDDGELSILLDRKGAKDEPLAQPGGAWAELAGSL